MSKQTEEEFVADFEAGMARMVARECYRAIHPGGMHTNGPTLVNIEVSRLLYVLSRWKKQPAQETEVCPHGIRAPHECKTCADSLVIPDGWCPICGGQNGEHKSGCQDGSEIL